MKPKMLPLIWVSLAIATCFVARAADTYSADPRAQRIRDLLSSGDVSLLAEPVWHSGQKLVVVLGENHASVASQHQEASVLERAVSEKLIDAILVEGSNGPIPTRKAAALFNRTARNRELSSYWDQQVSWGHIAGYEAVALRHPEIAVGGVEDMSEKQRYALEEELAEGNLTSESFRLAADAVDAAVQHVKEHHLETAN